MFFKEKTIAAIVKRFVALVVAMAIMVSIVAALLIYQQSAQGADAS